MAEGTFGTAINCMDGRTQLPVIQWMKDRFGVDYVDTITEPGPDKIMALGPLSRVDSIREKVSISVKAHGSTVVAVIGHHDCAGNPVSKEEHVDYIKQGVERVATWGFAVRVLGLWVDDRWRVQVVSDTGRTKTAE